MRKIRQTTETAWRRGGIQMKYFLWCATDSYERYALQEFDDLDSLSAFINKQAASGNPNLKFRVVQGVELVVKAVQTVTAYQIQPNG
jgi:hypothetical protein